MERGFSFFDTIPRAYFEWVKQQFNYEEESIRNMFVRTKNRRKSSLIPEN